MKKIILCSILGFIIIGCQNIYAVTLSTERVGFVDLEKIFEESEITEDVRNDTTKKQSIVKDNILQKEKNIKKAENEYNILISSITDIEAKIVERKKKVKNSSDVIEISTSTAQGISTSTVTVEISLEELQEYLSEYKDKRRLLKRQIREQKADFNEFEEDRVSEIEHLKESYSYNLLGLIYDVIVQVAVEEGCSIVIDKNSVLYGESLSDLSDKVIKKLSEKILRK